MGNRCGSRFCLGVQAEARLHGVAHLVGDHHRNARRAELLVQLRHQAVGVPGDDVGRGAVEGLVGQVGRAVDARRRRGAPGSCGVDGDERGDVAPLPAERGGELGAPELLQRIGGGLGDPARGIGRRRERRSGRRGRRDRPAGRFRARPRCTRPSGAAPRRRRARDDRCRRRPRPAVDRCGHAPHHRLPGRCGGAVRPNTYGPDTVRHRVPCCEPRPALAEPRPRPGPSGAGRRAPRAVRCPGCSCWRRSSRPWCCTFGTPTRW